MSSALAKYYRWKFCNRQRKIDVQKNCPIKKIRCLKESYFIPNPDMSSVFLTNNPFFYFCPRHRYEVRVLLTKRLCGQPRFSDFIAELCQTVARLKASLLFSDPAGTLALLRRENRSPASCECFMWFLTSN